MWLSWKRITCNAGDLGSIPGLGRSPGEGKGYPLRYSGLENSSGVTDWTRLSDFHFHFHFSLSSKVKYDYETLPRDAENLKLALRTAILQRPPNPQLNPKFQSTLYESSDHAILGKQTKSIGGDYY